MTELVLVQAGTRECPLEISPSSGCPRAEDTPGSTLPAHCFNSSCTSVIFLEGNEIRNLLLSVKLFPVLRLGIPKPGTIVNMDFPLWTALLFSLQSPLSLKPTKISLMGLSRTFLTQF